jgi:dihydroorotase
MSILIKQGRVVDPAQGMDAVKDILVTDGKVADIADSISANTEQVIDAKGLLVFPGLVDMHVHLREPGREDKETIETATTAALAGGVTSVLAMPNTTPCIDSAQAVGLLQKRVQKSAKAHVFIAGAITKNRKGHALVDFKGLQNKGVAAFTDDGSSLDDEKLFLKAFTIARDRNAVIICHCEDTALSAEGSVNRGIISTRMGLKGISMESEYKRIKRDIELAELAGSRVHIAHVSCAESVDIIRKAKQRGVQVTAETCPHYLMLCEEDVTDFDTNKKMNPPLRGADDQKALKQAAKDGTIDVLSSDHAPHTENEKDIEFERAAFGVIGLETLAAVGMTTLYHEGVVSISRFVELCSVNPARILGINKGSIAKGNDADIAILDPEREWVVEKQAIISKSNNCAFLGRRLKGKVVHTILNGELAYSMEFKNTIPTTENR